MTGDRDKPVCSDRAYSRDQRNQALHILVRKKKPIRLMMTGPCRALQRQCCSPGRTRVEVNVRAAQSLPRARLSPTRRDHRHDVLGVEAPPAGVGKSVLNAQLEKRFHLHCRRRGASHKRGSLCAGLHSFREGGWRKSSPPKNTDGEPGYQMPPSPLPTTIYPRFGEDDLASSPRSTSRPKPRGRATSKFIQRMLDDVSPRQALFSSAPELSSRCVPGHSWGMYA